MGIELANNKLDDTSKSNLEIEDNNKEYNPDDRVDNGYKTEVDNRNDGKEYNPDERIPWVRPINPDVVPIRPIRPGDEPIHPIHPDIIPIKPDMPIRPDYYYDRKVYKNENNNIMGDLGSNDNNEINNDGVDTDNVENSNNETSEIEKKGGKYGELIKISTENEEVHHMPADSVTELSRNDGPAIRMDKEDHRQTASCGSSKEAREYQAKQKEFIKEGKFREALQMDINDIRSKFGDKYDDAIKEMEKYVDKLEEEKRI